MTDIIYLKSKQISTYLNVSVPKMYRPIPIYKVLQQFGEIKTLLEKEDMIFL